MNFICLTIVNWPYISNLICSNAQKIAINIIKIQQLATSLKKYFG